MDLIHPMTLIFVWNYWE